MKAGQAPLCSRPFTEQTNGTLLSELQKLCLGVPAGTELEWVIELHLANLPQCQDQLSVIEKLTIRPHRFSESEYNVICEICIY